MKQPSLAAPAFEPVAVIGLGGMFPKSPGLYEYWRLLVNGVDAIEEIPPSHWSPEDYYDDDPKSPDRVYVRRGGFLTAVDFDPTEFGIPPNVLEATDTSQLLSLVVAKQLLADAGYALKDNFDHCRTSVVLGVTGTQELVIPLGARLGHPIWKKALDQAGIAPAKQAQVMDSISAAYVRWQESSFPGLLGNVVAGRISNRFNLGGTNCVVDAACASSLAALNTALLELTSGRSDMVLSGGVDTLNDIFMHKCFAATQILSASGDVRPFSAEADGTLLGEGIGMVLLKRLAEAQRDGDRIYALIRGIGSSSDGRSQSIYAPRKEGQMAALKKAYESAAIDPATIGMLEAHGTGTPVGDKVEVEALKEFFGALPDAPGSAGPPGAASHRCVLGSVKSMIGHTKAAAGAAGLLKGILALHHKVLLPTLKAEPPDPALSLDPSRFYLTSTARPWIANGATPRRCGVSSFGFGGSNFHVVLEEYQKEKQAPAWDGSVELLAYGADELRQLHQIVTELAQNAQSMTQSQIHALAAESRNHFSSAAPFRLVMVVAMLKSPLEAFKRALATAQSHLAGEAPASFWHDGGVYFGGEVDAGRLAFVFPGQGSQYCGMGNDLALRFPEALDALETANRCFSETHLLSDFIYPLPTADRNSKMDREADLRSTDVAQPAIGAVSGAMLRILQTFGLKPEATAGHSYGELPALWAAGKFDQATCVELSVARGALMAAAGRSDHGDPGSMLAVKAPLDEIEALIAESGLEVILANRNSPQQGVLSGASAAIDQAAELCKARKYKCVKLPVAAAFHSELVASAQKPFQEKLNPVRFERSAITPFANTTAAPYPDDSRQARDVLGRQIIHPVNFVEQIEAMHQWGVGTFVEVGPKTVLCGLINAILPDGEIHTIALDASAGRKSGLLDLAHALGHLAALGFSVDLSPWERRRNLPEAPAPKMKVTIGGANYRNRSPAARAAAPSPPAADPAAKPAAETGGRPPRISRPAQPAAQAAQPTASDFREPHPQPPAMDTPMNFDPKPKPPATSASLLPPAQAAPPGWLAQALETVQSGLQSIQALQRQTAQAHEKFLDTQAEASRTLQAIIQSTRALATGEQPAPAPMPTHPAPPVDPVPVPALESLPLSPPKSASSPKITSLPAGRDPQPAASPDSATQPSAAPQETPTSVVVPQLLEVVSDLTGYPVEMLDLTMDIEGDLGIDSIKRVEILSTLEEKMPHLPQVAPETMGSLKTLGQIAAYLEQGPPGAAKAPLTADPQLPPAAAEGERGIPPATASPPQERRESAEIERSVLAVVSDLTGYPVEMLGLEMNIEADLGIDSIKRVEILSTLEEKMPHLPAVSPEHMGRLNTLGEIIAYLASGPSQAQPEGSEAQSQENIYPKEIHAPRPTVTPKLERRSVDIRPARFHPGAGLALPPESIIVLIAPNGPLGDALELTLGQTARRAVTRYTWHEAAPALESFDQARAISGLVLVAENDSAAGPAGPNDSAYLNTAFAWAKLAEAGLNALPADESRAPATFLATISFLDGAFGFKGRGVASPLSGALAGLAKTVALEWPATLCRAFDLDDAWQDWQKVARRISAELLTPPAQGGVEIGLSSDLEPEVRNLLALKSLAPLAPSPAAPELTKEDVVLVSGGARGITAQALKALAGHCPATYILLGRSAEPFAEPEWLQGLRDPAAIKGAIARNESGAEGKPLVPKALEGLYQGYQNNREIRATLASLEARGARIIYRSLDVRDRDALLRLGGWIKSTYGPVKAVVHAAGILHDRRIGDKSMDQFQAVFDTKVQGLFNLLAAVDPAELKYVLLFSSVSARMGNAGQADYAMANEVLNKMAYNLALRYPETRVKSINWGPWEGGMVSDSLKAAFTQRGVALIDLEAGAAHLVAEMGSGGPPDPVEIVVGSGLSPALETAAQPPTLERVDPLPVESSAAPEPMETAFVKTIDLDRFPILHDHRLDGIPVVPFALMAEWFAHGALHANPGLTLVGLDDMRLMAGIRLEKSAARVQVQAGRASRENGFFKVPMEVRGSGEPASGLIHCRARVLLAERPLPRTALSPRIPQTNGHYRRTVAEVYRDVLFHGSGLQGIEHIESVSAEGMSARVATAPRPQAWLSQPLRSRWLVDPLVLDSAFQMASLWCFEQHGAVSLPSYAARYRQYCQRFPSGQVTIHLRVDRVQAHKIGADITFMDQEGHILGVMEGFEAVMDRALFKAFKPQNAA